ncbi:hypothetical protein ACFQZQ_14510 [Lysobacter koreensis]|uniref:Secreted protein n=1 Tax=Lysobacter koreensis TaxID=266122 RepID=A0ABW2YQ43_9GAMM
MALLLASTTFVAIAQPPYVNIEQGLSADQLHATGLDTLSPAQLEALNRLLRDKAGATAEATTAADAVRPSAQRERPPSSYIGLDDQPIRSRLKTPVAGWEPGTVFELANGQQWKVLKGRMTLRKPLDPPQIVVVPGVAGRWFLQVDEDLPKARVYRID